MKTMILFIRHLGIAAIIIMSGYTFLLKDVPFPYGMNRYVTWGCVVAVCLILVVGSFLLEKKGKVKDDKGKRIE